MYWIWGIHIFQFFFNSKIYVLKPQMKDDDGYVATHASSHSPAMLTNIIAAAEEKRNSPEDEDED